jgi:hypothetical protein
VSGWSVLERMPRQMNGTLSSAEQDFVDRYFVLPIRDAVTAALGLQGHKRRTLLEDQIGLDHRGNAVLCCSVYEHEDNRLGHFLELSEAKLDRRKQRHPTWACCAAHDWHLYMTYHEIPELCAAYDQLAQQRIGSSLALPVVP